MGLDIPIEGIADTKTSRVFVGSIERNKTQEFEDTVEDNTELMYLEKVGNSRDATNYLVIYHRSIEEEAEAILRQFGFINASFGDIEGTPKAIVKSLTDELQAIQQEKEEIVKRVEELASHIGKMQLLYDALQVELDRAEATFRLRKSDKTFFLKGWHHLGRQINSNKGYIRLLNITT